MKKVLLLILIPISLSAQFSSQKEKYWIYRERLKNFVVSGDCRGCGMPANSRDYYNNLNYNDSPWMIGYWIGTLAMEYKLLSIAGADLTQTKKDLFYAIEAINRLDYYAEESWGCAKSLNGFLIRDDIAQLFPTQSVNGETIADLMNEGLVPPPDDFRLKCMNSAFAEYQQPGSEASQDHLIGLFIGLRLVRAAVPSHVSWNNMPFSYETTTVSSFVQEVQRISERIILWLYNNNWVYWNPCANRCVYGVANNGTNDPNACYPHEPLCCNNSDCPLSECCSQGGALALPQTIGFAAVNQYIQYNSPGMPLASIIYNKLIKNSNFRSPWNVGLVNPGETSRLPKTLAALGNTWTFKKVGIFLFGTSTKNVAKKFRDLVENGDNTKNEGRYWEHLILLHRLLNGNQYDNSNNIITVSDAHYQCLLDAAPCRGFDGNTENVEWGWTDRLVGDRCNLQNYPNTCDGNSDARLDYMFYFNLFNCVVPQSASLYTPIPIKNLAPYDVTKPDVSASSYPNTLPFIEYDKKNVIAEHNISAQEYEVTSLASEGQGRVTFAAGNKIILGHGFKVTDGGYFRGYIDPIISSMTCIPPTNTNCEGVFKKATNTTENNSELDTTICSMDSIQVFYPEDTTGGYSYYWDFGNGAISNSPEPFIYYSTPGSYDILLVLSDSAGNVDTLRETIYISQCSEDSIPPTARIGENSLYPDIQNTNPNNYLDGPLTKITIIPNPSNSGIFHIAGLRISSSLTVINVLGEVIYQSGRGMSSIESIHTNTDLIKPSEINISNYPKGVYFVKIQDGGEVNVQKIIYQ